MCGEVMKGSRGQASLERGWGCVFIGVTEKEQVVGGISGWELHKVSRSHSR